MTRKTSVPGKVIPLRRKKAMSNGNPSKKIVTLGEILVEIMAVERGQSFLVPGHADRAVPRGAPAIFIDQVAKLGHPCGIIGCVGDDDFGWMNIERLKARRGGRQRHRASIRIRHRQRLRALSGRR